MKFCPYCGGGLQSNMTFCPVCGKKHVDAFPNFEKDDFLQSLETTAESEEKKDVDIEAAYSDEIEDTDDNNPEKAEDDAENRSNKVQYFSKKKKHYGIIIAISALLVVACVVIIIIAVSKNKKPDYSAIANQVLYLEMYRDKELVGTASGFLIVDSQTLVTNYHVIEPADSILAISSDHSTTQFFDSIIAYDEEKDIAILHSDKGLPVKDMKLGNSDQVKQGDKIYSASYPLGLSITLSDGMVSAIYEDQGFKEFQITAPISSGSSGGALINEKGEVVGVTYASIESGQNLNYAIAINCIIDLYSNAGDMITMAEFSNGSIQFEVYEAMNNGDYDLAIEIISKALEEFPDNTDNIQLRNEAYYQKLIECISESKITGAYDCYWESSDYEPSIQAINELNEYLYQIALEAFYDLDFSKAKTYFDYIDKYYGPYKSTSSFLAECNSKVSQSTEKPQYEDYSGLSLEELIEKHKKQQEETTMSFSEWVDEYYGK